MIKIITALANPKITEMLEKEQKIKVVTPDIQYQEGIFEILTQNQNVDKLLLSQLLPGKNNLKELIIKIKQINEKIEIFVFLEEKNTPLEKELRVLGIEHIFFHNQTSVEEIIKILTKKRENINELKQEIENLKNILEKNHIHIEENQKETVEKIKENQIIPILGTGGVGKSIVTIQMANMLQTQNKKILIIDFDILNNSLHTMLGVKKYTKKIQRKIKENDLIYSQITIHDLIIKINSSIDLVSGINLLFDSKYKISSEKIYQIIKEIKQYYDYILIDTSSECFFDYTKNILENSTQCIFLLEGNVSEIKKAKQLLNMYSIHWKIPQNKIKLLINKYNENAIEENVIQHIFKEYKILGKIQLNEKYNQHINEHFQFVNKHIQKEYQKIKI